MMDSTTAEPLESVAGCCSEDAAAAPADGFAHLGTAAVRRLSPYFRCKPALDFVAALLLLVPALPVMLVAALVVKLTSRGPALYRQTRLGRYGREFTLVKIRTMINNAEAETGPVWARPDDPRVTPVGWFLRLTHLDELPQLYNVLRGQMSLVGPRPERPELIPDLAWQLPGYDDRLQVRPGITGIAQLRQPPDGDIESVRRKLCYDLYYLQSANPWLDLRILAVTGFRWFCDVLTAFWALVDVPRWDVVRRRVPPVAIRGNHAVAGAGAQDSLGDEAEADAVAGEPVDLFEAAPRPVPVAASDGGNGSPHRGNGARLEADTHSSAPAKG